MTFSPATPSSIALWSALSLAGFSLFACSSDGGRAPAEDATLVSAAGSFGKTRGELDVAVSPRDKGGAFVGQYLEKDAFRFENVTISPSSSAAQSLDIDVEVTDIEVKQPESGTKLQGIVVFDSSGSMSGNDPGFSGRRAGGEAIFDLLGADDELAVIDFGSAVGSGLRASQVLQDFTSDKDALQASLAKLSNSGGTPLYESLLDALELLDAHHGNGGSLIVLTDGQATNTLLPQVIERANTQEVQIYAIGLGTSLDFADLSRLASETEGGFAMAQNASLLQSVFEGVGTGVRSGRVVVHGEGMYASLPASGTQLYKVQGELVTDDPKGELIRTPFSFITKLSN